MRGLHADVVSGLRWLRAAPAVRTLVLTILTFNITWAMGWGILVLWAQERVGLGPVGFGLLTSATAVGGVISVLAYDRIAARWSLAGIMKVSASPLVRAPANLFVWLIRGTPLLLQIWFLYYGLGSLFPQIPWIRGSDLWPYLRQAWPYALLALTLSFAGYEGEVMRGAFRSVARGQLEAARAFGMPRWTMFRRVWLPQAVRTVLPTLGGETVLQLKATPLVATITMVEIYAVSSRVRADTFIVYEPLLLLALVYLLIAGVIVLLFGRVERRVPTR